MRGLNICGIICIFVAIACGPSRRDEGPCMDGAVLCNGQVERICSGGSFHDGNTCPLLCVENLGCAMCAPGTGTCQGNTGHACNQNGDGFIDETCDPVQGSTCDPMSGACTGPCAATALGTSYIGCDYYPTVTGNTTGTVFDFAVAIANTAGSDAVVTIDGGALTTPMMVTVPSNAVKVQILPWQLDLKLCSGAATDACIDGSMGQAALVAHGAYHLRSTNPVTLYQFNSLEYVKNNEFSYSNDASLLLPTNVWRSRYYAAAWQALASINGSEMAVTAAKDGTKVTITSKADTVAGGGAPAFATGVAQSVMLNAGDVIEITSRSGDFTGTLVDADKPVQVISGHYCADVPDLTSACDHLEESMFSIDALGIRYIVNAPAVTSIPTGKVQYIRVIATQPGTTLTYDPPQAGAPATIANAGDFIEIPNTTATFMITASAKVLVSQYMEGQSAGGNTGDPAMTLAVPVEQFRTSYMFHAPISYESNYVDVLVPMGATVMLDGAPLPAPTAIGGTGYGLARVYPLTAGPGSDGNHTIEGTQAFGITVYGYGQYTSYWYPGGLNLTDLIN
jgi:hypothetical protein